MENFQRIVVDMLSDIHKLTLEIGAQKAPKQMLNSKEAAEYLSMSISTLRHLTSQNILPCYKPNGKLVYYDRSMLLDWMRSNYCGPMKYNKRQVETRVEAQSEND